MATIAHGRGRGSVPRSAAALVLVASACVLVFGGMAIVRSGEGERGSNVSTEPAGQPLKASTPVAAPPAKPAAPEIRFGISKPLPRTPGTLRLATYNTENLFDNFDDPALSGQYEDKDTTKAESELKGLSAAIHAADPDVIALDEIESEHALMWFHDAYLKDMGYAYHASIDAGDPRGIEQAVLSRFPITGVKNWPDAPLAGVHPEDAKDATPGTPIHYHRSPLKVDIEVPAMVTGGEPYRFTLLAVHQKSGKNCGYWREAEATKTASIVQELQTQTPGINVAVLGDCNAAPTDAAMKVYLTGGMIDVLAARESASAADRPKFITHESGRTIDYILVNPAMNAEVVASSAFVLGTPARPAGVDWRSYPAPDGYGSDHYPVVVDVRWKEGK